VRITDKEKSILKSDIMGQLYSFTSVDFIRVSYKETDRPCAYRYNNQHQTFVLLQTLLSPILWKNRFFLLNTSLVILQKGMIRERYYSTQSSIESHLIY
jgi:hypothetical protein